MKNTSFLLAVSMTGLFAAAAGAQSNPTSTPPPSNPPPTQVPQTPPPQQNTDPRSGTTSQGDQQNPTGGTVGNQGTGTQGTGTPPAFDQLDTTRSGYLNREAASGNPWLTRNFQRCDTDHDMRISRDEYEACVHSPTR